MSMSESYVIGVGKTLIWDGSMCTVVEIAGNAVVVKDAEHRLRRLRLIDLLKPVSEGGRARLVGDLDGGVPSPLVLLWAELSEEDREAVHERAGHVREVLTGFKSGSAVIVAKGEPRPEYAHGVSLSQRCAAKAAEIGVTSRTVEGWIKKYREADELGLLDRRRAGLSVGAGGIDARWIDVARAVLLEQVEEPKVPRNVVMQRIEARLIAIHGEGMVPIPSRSARYRALAELDRGRNTFSGSTKSKRSIANRPGGVFGRLSPTRPGEYVLLDTTRLDVFGLDVISGRWMNCELTAAMDLYSRAIVGMRITPTARSLDVAGVLLEAMVPFEIPGEWSATASLPYVGVPETLLVREDRIDVARFRRAMIPETIVVDHGKPFVSEHVMSACARLGISVQPARVYMPTDKAAVERFFRTIQELLAQLPGFKGEELSARGKAPEEDAVYTIPELERVVREWVATVYHLRPHGELMDPLLPGVQMSPQQRYEQGIAVAGALRIPVDRNITLEMLPVQWRNFNHYGVEIDGLRYKGDIITKYRNVSRSPQSGQKRRWPFSVNPDDLRFVYFRDPDDGVWHTLTWERLSDVDAPFSLDALEFAKKLAVDGEEAPDTAAAIRALLDRWGAGQHLTPKERRASARLVAAHRDEAVTPEAVSLRMNQEFIAKHREQPESLRAELTGQLVPDTAGSLPPGGDDDLDEELDATEGEDFYATALEDL